MKPKNTCPLSPALIDLLQACVDARCIKDKMLAERLCLSPQTVHTNFRRVAEALGTHDRFEAIYIAYENGWIRFAPPPPLKHSLRMFHKQTRENCPCLGACHHSLSVLQSSRLH